LKKHIYKYIGCKIYSLKDILDIIFIGYPINNKKQNSFCLKHLETKKEIGN